ncbi:MAG TPA: ABC transporter permease subunit, partial [Actinomycetota bacterium]
PVAYLVSRFRFPGRSVLRVGVLVAFVLPTVVVGTAFAGAQPSLGALFAAHVFFNLAVVVGVVGSFWGQLDPAFEDMAVEMGARGFRRFTDVLWPLSRPSILGAASLVFLFTFTSFGVVLLLGGPGRVTIEVEIYRQTSQLLNLPAAAALTVVQVAIVVSLLWVTSVLSSRGGVRQGLFGARDTVRSPRTGGERWFVLITASATAIAILGPPARLVWRSISSAGGLTFSRYTQLGSVRRGSALPVSALDAVARSLVIAFVAAMIALTVGGLAAMAVARSRRGSWLRSLSAVPLGVSAVAVGFGYVVAFDAAPLDLRGEPWLVAVVQAVVAVPFVVVLVTPVLTSIHADLTDAAASLGATPWHVTRDVVLPMSSRAFLGAGAFAFAISLGEFGATAFVARLDAPTMPLAVVRLLSQPGAANRGQAMAMSVLLMGVTASVAVAIERMRIGSWVGRV